jgi:hypothetical protein
LEPVGLRGPFCLTPRRIRHRRYEPVYHPPSLVHRLSYSDSQRAPKAHQWEISHCQHGGGLPPSDPVTAAFPMSHRPCRALPPGMLIRAVCCRVRRSPFSLERRLLPGLSDAVALAAETIQGGSSGAALDLQAARVLRLPFQVRATSRCAPPRALPAAGPFVPALTLRKVSLCNVQRPDPVRPPR